MSDETKLAKLRHLRKLSDLWDRSVGVPGTKFRVGLESLIGLLPIGGDVIGIILSVYILFQAIQFRLPLTILVRMLFNIILDGAVGSIPILGDLFDTTWKANTRNVNLLEAHLRDPVRSKQTNQWFLFLLLTVLIVVLVCFVAISIMVVWLVWILFHR
jgi:hypothetical protein